MGLSRLRSPEEKSRCRKVNGGYKEVKAGILMEERGMYGIGRRSVEQGRYRSKGRER